MTSSTFRRRGWFSFPLTRFCGAAYAFMLSRRMKSYIYSPKSLPSGFSFLTPCSQVSKRVCVCFPWSRVLFDAYAIHKNLFCSTNLSGGGFGVPGSELGLFYSLERRRGEIPGRSVTTAHTCVTYGTSYYCCNPHLYQVVIFVDSSLCSTMSLIKKTTWSYWNTTGAMLANLASEIR